MATGARSRSRFRSHFVASGVGRSLFPFPFPVPVPRSVPVSSWGTHNTAFSCEARGSKPRQRNKKASFAIWQFDDYSPLPRNDGPVLLKARTVGILIHALPRASDSDSLYACRAPAQNNVLLPSADPCIPQHPRPLRRPAYPRRPRRPARAYACVGQPSRPGHESKLERAPKKALVTPPLAFESHLE